MAENKIRVERGNVVLHVWESEKRHYLNMGYNVTDEFGNILEETVPNDLGTLQRFYVDGKKKIADLEAQVKELQEANKVDIVEKIKAETEEKPATKRGRKKAE